MGLYGPTMKLAVQLKRIANGTYGQTGFTRFLEKIQFKSPEELKLIQGEFLCELLNHAVENIPYYKSLKGQLKLQPKTIFTDIREFPIITKEILVEKREELTDHKIPIIGKLETSGTLGKKSIIYLDKYSFSHAPDEFFNKKIGMVPGKSRFIFKADENRHEANIIGGIDYDLNNWSKCYRLNHHYLNKEKLQFIIELWKKKKPKILWGNTHGIYIIANYLKMNDIKVPSPEIVLTGGQQMLPEYKRTIEDYLSTKVYDRYGSVEAGNTANQCQQRQGYHYVPVTHFIEVLDIKLKQVDEGETGEIYITTLSKRGMPMIRYRQGDPVVNTNKTCPCGCNFPIIKEIIGKRKEGLVSPLGTFISNTPVRLIVKDSGEVSDFQIFQTAEDRFLLKLQTGTGTIMDKTLNKITDDIRSAMSYNMNIDFEILKNIDFKSVDIAHRVVPLDRYREIEGNNYETL